MFGLLDRDLKFILEAVNEYSEIEYPLPCFFDVVIYKDISNEELKKHIDSVGKSIYKRN